MFILTKGSDKFSSKIVINGDIDTANKFKTNLTIVKSVVKSNENRKILLSKDVTVGHLGTLSLNLIA